MTKHFKSLLAIALVFSISNVFAQKNPLTLEEAYDAAVKHYPGMMAKQAQIQASKHQEKQVASQTLPQANIQLQNSYGTLESSTGSFFPLPGTFNVSGNSAPGSAATHNTYASILADWEIYSFGKNKQERKAAALQVKEAESGLTAYELGLKSTISRLFFTILHHQVKLDWADRNTGRVKDILNLSISLASAGLTPGADTALASSSYLQIQSDHNLWTGMYQASRHALNEFTYLENENFQVDPTPFLTLRMQHNPLPETSNTHPFLRQLGDNVEVQRTLMEAKGRSVFPSISLLGGFSSRGTGAGKDWVSNRWKDGFQNGRNNYLIGLGIKWNLTGIYQTKLEHKKTEQHMRIAEASFLQRERQLNAAMLSTSVKLTEQKKQVLNTTTAVERAKEAYRLYRTRYESGLINLTELLQIQLLLQQAEAKQIDAFNSYWEQMIVQAEASGDFETLFEILK